jgi:membrane protein DedA with SNARE-associated domain
MHFLTDYITPFTSWLHNHPNNALLFTFLIAFAESLAVIGTIIPGSLTMTAIGILAGSGVMRFDFTLCFATLGAFVGDSASYTLGYVYRNSLSLIWPFKRYPNLLNYGKDYFNRHGKKSVLIGRFIGPLRSIIPLIAGMLNMPKFEFIISNILSAIGWSILYLLPGYIIGAASSQLSSGSAQRLFMFVLMVLVTIWVASQLIHYVTKHLHQSFTRIVNTAWLVTRSNPYTLFLITQLTNPADKKQQHIIRLLMTWLTNLVGTLILFILVMHERWTDAINKPVSLFLNTLRTPVADKIFILFTFIISPFPLIVFSLVITCLSCYRRDWRFLKYWISLNLSTALATSLCAWKFTSATAIPLFAEPSVLGLFPAIPLCFATALFTFMLHYLSKNHKPIGHFLAYTLSSLLLITGFATLYLGDNWLTSVLGAYSIGFMLGMFHWILYRRKHANPYSISVTLVLMFSFFAITTSIIYVKDFNTVVSKHTLKPKQYTLNQDTWWYQDEPILPRYSTNRIGQRSGMFNVQYAGSIQELENRLSIYGWHKQARSFLYSLLIHAEGRDFTETLPFTGQLYLNKLPVLTMTYTNNKNEDLYIFRLWRSNYHLMHYQEPIWLGNIILSHKKNESNNHFNQKNSDEVTQLFIHILPAVHDYQITKMPTAETNLKSHPYKISTEVLIIKN